VAEITIVTYFLGTVCPVRTATYTRGRTELHTLTVQNMLWSVGSACLGEFHADSTICKYFNANFMVLTR
jgi:hypothetical protein